MKQVKIFIDWYCKTHNIKYRLLKRGYGGYAHPKKGIIFLPYKISTRRILTYLFHEAMHIRCYRERIYFRYHWDYYCSKILRKQAFLAEKKVDIMAEEEMKAYFPYLKYDRYYSDPKQADEAKKWLLEYYND